MGYLSRRTEEQVRYSVEVEKDFTGGYNFFAWLLWLRIEFIFILLGALVAIGIGIYQYSIAGIAIPMGLLCIYLIAMILSYKNLKKGITG